MQKRNVERTRLPIQNADLDANVKKRPLLKRGFDTKRLRRIWDTEAFKEEAEQSQENNIEHDS